MIDLHSHLLPGLDDGPEEVSETLEIIKGMSSLGYIEIVPTPHKFHSLFNPDPNIVMGRIAALKKTMVRRFSFEYMCNIPKIKELSDHREFSRTSNGYKVIMVEFSPFVGKSEIERSVFSLNASGFIPLLAHIERYLKDDEFWLELKKKYKVFFQSSVRTLAKASFHPKKKQVIRFLEKGIIDNLGTDLHRASQLESVDKGLTFLRNNFAGYGKDLFSDKFLFENS
jgi:protein-tyrosine phosphatase